MFLWFFAAIFQLLLGTDFDGRIQLHNFWPTFETHLHHLFMLITLFQQVGFRWRRVFIASPPDNTVLQKGRFLELPGFAGLNVSCSTVSPLPECCHRCVCIFFLLLHPAPERFCPHWHRNHSIAHATNGWTDPLGRLQSMSARIPLLSRLATDRLPQPCQPQDPLRMMPDAALFGK